MMHFLLDAVGLSVLDCLAIASLHAKLRVRVCDQFVALNT